MHTNRAVTRPSSEPVSTRPIVDRQTPAKTLPSLAVGKGGDHKTFVILIFTAHQRNCWKAMFSDTCVCPEMTPDSDIWRSRLEICSNLFSWGHPPPGADIWWTLEKHIRWVQAGGAHPTGIFSCFFSVREHFLHCKDKASEFIKAAMFCRLAFYLTDITTTPMAFCAFTRVERTTPYIFSRTKDWCNWSALISLYNIDQK